MSKQSDRNTVLVIEDDDSIRNFVKKALELEGYAVSTASNGNDGLKKARSEKPALVLLDLRLPGIDGWEILKKIRADKGIAGTSIIVFSASVDEPYQEQALALGASGYLHKPISVADLRSAVARVLGQQGTKNA